MERPTRKTKIDGRGAALLIGISALLGLNQALVKLVNAGMAPTFQAGLRSAVAIIPVLLYCWWRQKKLSISDGSLLPGIVCGLFFFAEFFLLFNALDYTSVGRSSVLFYTMPIWVAVAAHFLIPDEKLTRQKILGLFLALAGVIIALTNNDKAASGDAFKGDLMALLAATGWAGIAIVTRTTKLSRSTPEMQLVYQLIVSAPILLIAAYLSDETFRQMSSALWGIFTFQVLVVVAFGFALWFWILSIYPASNMASYAFLTPLFGVLFGWLVFDETLTISIIFALFFVGTGIYLVNRHPV